MTGFGNPFFCHGTFEYHHTWSHTNPSQHFLSNFGRRPKKCFYFQCNYLILWILLKIVLKMRLPLISRLLDGYLPSLVVKFIVFVRCKRIQITVIMIIKNLELSATSQKITKAHKNTTTGFFKNVILICSLSSFSLILFCHL